MLTFQPAKDRWKLGFKEAVLESFDYLRSYGLECVQADVTFVRYDSPKTFVNVFHGRGSYELGVEIGQHGDPVRSIAKGLYVLLGWRGAPERRLPSGESLLFTSDIREGVQELVPKMAALFRKYADSLLRGDEQAFESLDLYYVEEARRTAERYGGGTPPFGQRFGSR